MAAFRERWRGISLRGLYSNPNSSCRCPRPSSPGRASWESRSVSSPDTRGPAGLGMCPGPLGCPIRGAGLEDPCGAQPHRARRGCRAWGEHHGAAAQPSPGVRAPRAGADPSPGGQTPQEPHLTCSGHGQGPGESLSRAAKGKSRGWERQEGWAGGGSRGWDRLAAEPGCSPRLGSSPAAGT